MVMVIVRAVKVPTAVFITNPGPPSSHLCIGIATLLCNSV